jgi:hypothetical protein
VLLRECNCPARKILVSLSFDPQGSSPSPFGKVSLEGEVSPKAQGRKLTV